MTKDINFRAITAFGLIFAFLTNTLGPIPSVYAQEFSINQLPVPGSMVGESAPFTPLALKGLVINLQKPLEFQFIVDTGHGPQDTASVKDQANQLVKYFLAGLTIPEGDLWVNLSPYEKNRMVPEALGETDLGRDLLAQDYILKQLTASLIYPEKDLGKEFWSRVYAKAQEQFGTTNVPVNTFNKVWILPDQAQVFEHGAAAYVTKATLKVMLDEDYTALQKHLPIHNSTDSIGSQIIRQIVIPEISKEVNHGRNFAPLRQIYQALILAKWYKETIQNGLLDVVYTNKNKVAGVNLNDPAIKEQIYNRYLQAYKKGAFNYIKDDPMPDGQVVPRKYFSGGISRIEPAMVAIDGALSAVEDSGRTAELDVSLEDAAMSAGPEAGGKPERLSRREGESLADFAARLEDQFDVSAGGKPKGLSRLPGETLAEYAGRLEGIYDVAAGGVSKSTHHLSGEELNLLKKWERDQTAQGFVSRWGRDDERIKKQVIQIETAFGNSEGAESKAAQIINDLNTGKIKFKGEEVHILNGTGPGAKVIGRIDRNIAEKYGYIHETANVVLLTPDGKVILQMRNKENSDDHLAMYGGHLGVGESHEAAIIEETKQETRLDSLDNSPVFVGYQSYSYPGITNREKRSWFVKILTKREYDEMKAKAAAEEASLGINRDTMTKEEHKAKLFEIQRERKDGSGEVRGTHELTFDDLTFSPKALDGESPFSDKTNHYLTITETYQGKWAGIIRAFLSPGSTNTLLLPENKELWQKIQETAINLITKAGQITRELPNDRYAAVIKSWLQGNNQKAIITASDGTDFVFKHEVSDVGNAKTMVKTSLHSIQVFTSDGYEVGHCDFSIRYAPHNILSVEMHTAHKRGLAAIYVDDKFTSKKGGIYQGIGRSLMGFAERLAYLIGGEYFAVSGVEIQNFGFYTSVGYQFPEGSEPGLDHEPPYAVFKSLQLEKFSNIAIDRAMLNDAYEHFSLDRDELLGISFEEAEEEIKKQYHRLSFKVHPDYLEAQGKLDRQDKEAYIAAGKAFSDLTDDFKLILEDIKKNRKPGAKADKTKYDFEEILRTFREAMEKEAKEVRKRRMEEAFKQWGSKANQNKQYAEMFASLRAVTSQESWSEFMEKDLLNSRRRVGISLQDTFRMQIVKKLVEAMDSREAIKNVLDTAAGEVRRRFKEDDFTEPEDFTRAEEELRRSVGYFDTYFGILRGISAQLDKSVGRLEAIKRSGLSASVYNFIETVCQQSLHDTPFTVQSFEDYLAAWGEKGILDVSHKEAEAALEAYHAIYPERLTRNEKSEYIVQWFHIASAREGKIQTEAQSNPVYILSDGSRVEIIKLRKNEFKIILKDTWSKEPLTINYEITASTPFRNQVGRELDTSVNFKQEKGSRGNAPTAQYLLYKDGEIRVRIGPRSFIAVVLEDIIERILKGNIDSKLASITIEGELGSNYTQEDRLTMRELLKKLQIQYLPPANVSGDPSKVARTRRYSPPAKVSKPEQNRKTTPRLLPPAKGSSIKSKSTRVRHKGNRDEAQISGPGGIDLNQINVNRTGKMINVQFDPAQLNELAQSDFKGFRPVMTGYKYIQSPFLLLGINNPTKEPEVLAKA